VCIPIAHQSCQSAGVGHLSPHAPAPSGDQRAQADAEAASAERRGQPSAHATGDAVRRDLSQRLSDLARKLQHQSDASAVMEHIVSAVAGMIPGAEEASISLVQGRRRVMSAGATGERARRFDDL
jgi:hypothetical protein